MEIAKGHKANFEMLKTAFANGDVAIMDCFDTKTGEVSVVLCMVNEPDNDYELVPVALFFNENPYERLAPPNPGKSGTYLFPTT